MMKKILKEWQQFITEEGSEIQDEYIAHYRIDIVQAQEIDRTEVLGFMRGIDNVTTVRKEKELSHSGEIYSAEFAIRFVLSHGSRLKAYIEKTLEPELKDVIGIQRVKKMSVERVGEA